MSNSQYPIPNSQIISVCLALVLFSQLLFAQSEFIERGSNGYLGGTGFFTNKETNGFNIFAGFSYMGFIDGKLTFSKYNHGKIQSGVLMPSIKYYIFKQEDSKRVPTLGISLGFCKYSAKETKTFIEPDTNIITWRSYQRTEESTINAFILGATAQKRIGFWKMLFFEPILGTNLAMKKGGWDFSISGGVVIGTRVVNGPLLVLIPSLERQSGKTTFLLSLNAVF